MNPIQAKIVEIFNESQEPCYDIDGGIQQLKQILTKISTSEPTEHDILSNFINTMIHCIEVVLSSSETYRSHLVTEFLIQILIQFSNNPTEILIQNKILLYLISINRANSDTVRSRLFEILKKYLDTLNLASNGELDEKIFSKFQQICLEGTRDSNLSAQKNAIKAAFQLQVPSEKNCKIINGFLSLLEHDSNTEIRLLVLNSIAINNLTFNFIKNYLIYDSVEEMRQKALEIIEKKVPNKFFDSNFKQKIINCLIRNKDEELLVKFIKKWVNLDANSEACLEILKFLNNLELEKIWFTDMGYDYLVYIEEKNFFVLKLLLNEILQDGYDDFLSKLKDLIQVDKLLENFNLVFMIRAFLKFHQDAFMIGFLTSYSKLVYKMIVPKINKMNTLNLYNLIELLCSLELDKFKILKDIIYFSNCTSSNFECVYESLLKKFDTKTKLNLIWNMYKDLFEKQFEKKELKKILSVLSLVLSTMTNDEYKNANMLDLNLDLNDRLNDLDMNIDLNQNIIEYLVENLIIKHFSNLDPKVRSLAARALGHASLLSIDIAANYFDIFNKMIYLDYSEPVSEATKSLVNIILSFSDKIGLSSEFLFIAFERLENQLDCTDSQCKYLACEGFCKLLLNNIPIPNKPIILSKLVLIYFRSDQDNDSTSLKLKACLGEFFQQFKNDELYNGYHNYQNSILLSKTIKTVLRFLIKKNLPISVLKQACKFYYYLTSECKNARLVIINIILEEIFSISANYYLTQKLIEALVEFNIHERDIDLEKKCGTSVKYINQAFDQLQKLFIFNSKERFKDEKWVMARENEVRNLIFTIRMFKNRFNIQTKRKSSEKNQANKENLPNKSLTLPKRFKNN